MSDEEIDWEKEEDREKPKGSSLVNKVSEGFTKDSLKKGGAAGGTGFVLGYIALFIILKLSAFSAALSLYTPFWKSVFWTYYEAHSLPRIVNQIGLLTEISLMNPLIQYSIPISVLVGGGYYVGKETSEKAGASIVAGYLPLVIVSLVISTGVDGMRNPVMNIAVAGIAYPIIFGTIGSLLTGYVGKFTNPE